MLFSMLLGPSDCPRLQFNVLSIDFVRVTNCFYDYDYKSGQGERARFLLYFADVLYE